MKKRIARISGIEYVVPESILSNEMLAAEFPEWSVEKIFSKTGIAQRAIVAPGECASDLAVKACLKLFEMEKAKPESIDFIILCTQSPDYFLPATACIIQHRIGLPKACGAFDFNQGCSGFVYGLGIAKGLIESGQASNVLLVTAETYSRFINPGDKSVRTLFGDGAAAIVVSAEYAVESGIDHFVYGTDGGGAQNLIVPAGGMRLPLSESSDLERVDESGNRRSDANLYMNGPAIFEFTMNSVPTLVDSVLLRAGLTPADVDIFAFHQANRFMLDSLRRRIRIPPEKFLMSFEKFGNTVSSTIPIALAEAEREGKLKRGQRIMTVGFGVGYSWAGCLLRW